MANLLGAHKSIRQNDYNNDDYQYQQYLYIPIYVFVYYCRFLVFCAYIDSLLNFVYQLVNTNIFVYGELSLYL